MNDQDLQILIKHSSSPVRRHLLMASFVLLATIIRDQELLKFYLIFGVIGVLVVVLLASFTSARNQTVIFVDGFISAIMFVVFEYFAIAEYNKTHSYFDTVFLLRQAIALIFLAVLYLSFRLVRENKLIDEIEKS